MIAEHAQHHGVHRPGFLCMQPLPRASHREPSRSQKHIAYTPVPPQIPRPLAAERLRADPGQRGRAGAGWEHPLGGKRSHLQIPGAAAACRPELLLHCTG